MKEKRYCTNCEENKPITEFIKRKLSPDGYHSLCNDCREEKEREYEKLRAFATKGMDRDRFKKMDLEEDLKQSA